MMSIRTPESNYKTAAKSAGYDPTTMSASEIAAWKAVHKGIEADYLIDVAFNGPREKREDMTALSEHLASKAKS